MRKTIFALVIGITVAACASEPSHYEDKNDEGDDLGIAWVKDSAEYQAVSLQVFRAATLALPHMIADSGWSSI